MRAQDIIAKKKAGLAHSWEELEFWVKGIVNGTIPDYQITAWLMAVCFTGMTLDETVMFTRLIAQTGDMLDLSYIGDNIMDKHSTGGVGDKISLVLIPLVAACGGKMSKLSGRGLGFTGGTIDKLNSIKGFNTDLTINEFTNQVKNIGCAIAAQTAQLACADKKLYHLRDVTATIDKLPLIASSVMSKKIASGADIIVLDVKYGNGAFVSTKEQAQELSEMMVEIGKRAGRSVSAVISSMENPLGYSIGNALEVIEAIEALKGNGAKDVMELTFEIASLLLCHAKIAQTKKQAKEMLEKAVKTGAALNKFKELIEAQGGDSACINDYSKLPTANIVESVYAEKSGYIIKYDTHYLAVACKMLGAGRDKQTDDIDYSVGIVLYKQVGDKVEKGDKIMDIHANDESKLSDAKKFILPFTYIADENVTPEPLIYKVIE